MHTRRGIAATALAAALPLTAGADTVLYGKMAATINAINDDLGGAATRDNYELLSNASRLGVQGSTRLTGTLNAIYKAEYEIALDGDEYSNDGNVLKQRNIYVGLQGPFGTLLAGKHDTPTKLAQGKVDRFNDYYYGDIKYVFVGENRENDIVMYTTPKYRGFAATMSFQPGEDKTGSDDGDRGVADYVSGALSYTTDTLYLAVAGDRDLGTSKAGEAGTDILRVVADYRIGAFTLGGMLQTAQEHGEGTGIATIDFPMNSLTTARFEDQDAFLVSGEYRLRKWKLKAQYARSEMDDLLGLGGGETTQWSLGVDYLLAEKTALHGYYSAIESEVDWTAPLEDAESDTFGLGIQHDF